MTGIEKLTGEKYHLIDREIESVFAGDVPNLHDAVLYHLGTGGKRLRALLAIATYEALSRDTQNTSMRILPFAAACEIMHNWFLVHDDIEDGDQVRRDQPAVWVKYGLAHGVNVGDYMAQKVFELILRSKNYGVDDATIFKLLEAMVTTAIKTSEGQAMDINMRSYQPSEKDYMDMVMAKTGHYLTVTMVGAAILAKREEIVPGLIEFGSFIGPAFQITDDILDLTEGKGRGEIGRDIKEGKKSILAIHCMGKCGVEERQKLLDILNKPPEETADSDIALAINLFKKYGSIDYAKSKTNGLKERAAESVNRLPSELHEILNFFADYLVKRNK